MASEVYQLAVLLTLKDMASSGLDRVHARLRSLGQNGRLLAEEFENIRENLNRDLAIGGTGVAGLALLKKGVDEAGNLEQTILNLKQAYQEVSSNSGKSRQQQEDDIKKLLALSTDLGNNLQGNTADYADIFTAMNKAGIDAETTLTGAGRAAAYLANVTGALRRGTAPQQAEDLGSFGKMFDIKGQEYLKIVELFSALEDRFNISSGSLIESSKYFFSTAKGVMGLRGLSGAEDTAKLFAFAKRYAGREGSEAGTSLDAIITQFVSNRKRIESLAKDKGIKLEFFDAKGNFQGVENMFAQLEKLKALSPEERGVRLQNIFGDQGARIASQMVEQGVSGWRTITEEANKSVSVNEKIQQQMDTYTAKTEALAGSWQNFKATAFTPLMESTKQFLDISNSAVGHLQKFSAENPGLMKTVGTLAFFGSTALVVYSSFKTLTTGIQLFRLASAFSRADGLVTYLNQTNQALTTTATSAGNATNRVSGLRGALNTIGNSTVVRIGVQIGAIMGLEYAISTAVQSYINSLDAQKGRESAIVSNTKITKEALNDPNISETEKRKMAQSTASSVLFTLNANKELDDAFSSSGWLKKVKSETLVNLMSGGMPVGSLAGSYSDIQKMFPNHLKSLSETWWGSKYIGNQRFENSYTDITGKFSAERAATEFRKNAPQLENPAVMREMVQLLREKQMSPENQNVFQKGLQEAFPESYAQAMQQLNQQSGQLAQNFSLLSQNMTNQQTNLNQFGQQQVNAKQNFNSLLFPMVATEKGFMGMPQPMQKTQQSVLNLSNSANQVPSPLNSLSSSATSASTSLDNLALKIGNFQLPTPQIQTFSVGVPTSSLVPNQPSSIFNIPSRAIGGVVEHDGLAQVHAGNIITPARITKGLKTMPEASSTPVINFSAHITINGGDKDVKQQVEEALKQAYQQFEARLTRELRRGRERA